LHCNVGRTELSDVIALQCRPNGTVDPRPRLWVQSIQ